MAAYNGIAEDFFASIPLFVLMGLLVSISNVGKDTFTVAEVLLRKLRGGQYGIVGTGAWDGGVKLHSAALDSWDIFY
jgi:TRAP-type C4-dicarboxylate transport system permease large subunit